MQLKADYYSDYVVSNDILGFYDFKEAI